MRASAALLTLAVAGLFAGVVAAATPTVPAVTVPSVSTPSVTTPIATVPSITTPVVTTPAVTTPTLTTPAPPTLPAPAVPALPKPPAAPPTGATMPAQVDSSAATAPSPAASNSAGPTFAPASPSPASPFVPGAAATARTRSAKAQPGTIRFSLERRARVRVSVWQQAPRCFFLGRYVYGAERGQNALRLRRRVGGRAVVNGTYHLIGIATGAKVLDVRVRILRRPRTLEIRRTHLRNTCVTGEETEFMSALGAGLFGPTFGAAAQHPERQNFTPPAIVGSRGGTKAESEKRSVLRGVVSSPTSRAILFVLVGLAAALLAAGAVPGAAGGALARHRPAVTSAGLALLLAAVLVVLLT